MATKEFLLDGLDCASCAGEIESKTCSIPKIKNANVNFVTQTLKLELDEKDADDENLLNEVKKIVNTIEPDIVMSKKETHKTKSIVTEFSLKGLDCADCANQIDEGVNKMEKVKEASLNFVTQVLKVESSGISENVLLQDIKILVNKLEPDVIVTKIEKRNSSNFNEYLLDGLDCASCALEIEEKVAKIENILESSLNFVTKTLKVTYKQNADKEKIFAEIKKIVKELEPDVVVSNKVIDTFNDRGQEVEQPKEKYIIPRVISAGILLAIGLLVNFPNNTVKVLVLLASYLIVGYDVIITAVKNIFNGNIFDENFLMAIASIGAFLIKEYPEGVAVMMFYQLGEYFQGKAVDKSRRSITDLMDIKPDFANKIINDEIEVVSPYDVYTGDTILIRPGEKIPLDAVVIDGASSVDTVALTGESVPVTVREGDEILSGSININGVLTATVLKEFGESTVSKVLDLVENASSKKSTRENFITRFSRYYTPAVVLMATFVAIVFPLITGDPFSQWLHIALTFLVISCPCALVISIPLGYFGGIGAASSRGILVKGGNFLDVLGEVDTMVFDKTGTITKGVFKVMDIKTYNGFTDEELLRYTAHAENYSTHPIATSIIGAYEKNIDDSIISGYEELAGHGIIVNIDGKEVLAGNAKLLKLKNIDFEVSNTSDTIVYVSIDKKYAGYIIIADEIKKDSKKAIQDLHDLGITSIMLSGDNKQIANKVGEEVGIDKVYAELLPDDKVSIFEEIMESKTTGKKTAMVGDGINDAPVLTRSDVGIAMGGVGSDAAIEAADVVIMTDELSKIAESIRISKITRKVVVQNIVLALSIKAIVLVLGIIGIASMWAAVIADVGVSLIAILNSSRILRIK